MKNESNMVPLIVFCLLFMPLMAFLLGSIYSARQPVDVHRLVAECLADPNCAR